jgi:hypothetical protein
MLDKEFHIRITVAGLLRFLLSPYFIVPAVVLVLVVPWSSESAPAWVQAIGSVAAVGVAIRIAGLQERRLAEASRQKERVVITAVGEIARRGSMWIDEIHKLASAGEAGIQRVRFIGAIDNVEREWQRAQAIRMIDLPDESTLKSFIQLDHNLRSCVDSARSYLAGAKGAELNSIGIKITFNRDIVKNIAQRLTVDDR